MHQNCERDEMTDGEMNRNHGDEMTDGEMQSKGRSMHLHNYEGNVRASIIDIIMKEIA